MLVMVCVRGIGCGVLSGGGGGGGGVGEWWWCV
jgi:hypothetical protein